jgi:phosphatidylserine decarboxylase
MGLEVHPVPTIFNEHPMGIHREGTPTISITALVCGLLSFLAWKYWGESHPMAAISCTIILVAFLLFILSFFRVPKRVFHKDPSAVIAPADGKVVVIEEMHDGEYFKDRRLQVSIFMSPLNVHVNWCPIAGEVVYGKYHPGKYLVAWDPKSSTENERHSVVIRNEGTTLLVKQIAGALARRIVNYLEPGSKVVQNGELGFIKFGSRVDILLPPGTPVNVSLGDRVTGGVTVIARI